MSEKKSVQPDFFLSDEEVKKREEEKMKRAEEAQEKRLIEEAMREEGFISAEEKKAQTEKSRESWIELCEKLGVKVKIGKENIQKKLFK
ncbi:MAG: hypothetical protein US61_C0037G0009 [Parcubacteria group bacterium GW2011_GWE2_37_8]|nr:MAG: hypothetical protein US61_C0037G0009 [Parcubacteria group bacterium GW2011_GWE2_37_8]